MRQVGSEMFQQPMVVAWFQAEILMNNLMQHMSAHPDFDKIKGLPIPYFMPVDVDQTTVFTQIQQNISAKYPVSGAVYNGHVVIVDIMEVIRSDAMPWFATKLGEIHDLLAFHGMPIPKPRILYINDECTAEKEWQNTHITETKKVWTARPHKETTTVKRTVQWIEPPPPENVENNNDDASTRWREKQRKAWSMR